MPIINADKIINAAKRDIQNARIKAVAIAATKAAQQTESRIFDKGQNVDDTSSRKPRYSKGYAKLRSNEGLQVAIVDYERTGQLRDEFDLDILGDGVAILSIQGRRAKISRFLEQKRGSAFAADKRDIALMELVLVQKLSELL